MGSSDWTCLAEGAWLLLWLPSESGLPRLYGLVGAASLVNGWRPESRYELLAER